MRSRRLILTISLILTACVCLDSWAAAQRSRGGRGGSPSRSSGSVQRSSGSSRPSARPSQRPSSRPSARPSPSPSSRSNSRPSARPSPSPSSRPSAVPDSRPSYRPSRPESRPASTPTYRRSSPVSRDRVSDDFGRNGGSSSDVRSDRRDVFDGAGDSRDLGRPVGRPDGPSGSVRDALSDVRPTTDRGSYTFERAENGTTTTLRRPFARDHQRESAIVDLRPASEPRPPRVRFPRSYREGERIRRARAERDGRLDAVERDRLYRARAAGRDAALRSRHLSDSGRLSDARDDRAADPRDPRSDLGDTARERLRRAADGSLSRGDRSVSDGFLSDRARDARRPSDGPPRLSQGRIDRVREARRRASASASSSGTNTSDRARRKRAHEAHFDRARKDARYAENVRADQRVLQAATEVVVSAGIGVGVTLGGGGWHPDFASGFCHPYDAVYTPSWCGPPLYYGFNACFSWGWNSWWCRPFFRPWYQHYRPSIGFWWGPWSTSYWGSTIVIEQPVREIVYVEERYADEARVPPADVAAAPAPRGTRSAAAGSSDALRRSAGRYLELGDDAFLQGEYGRAVHYYAKAIELSPDDGVLYLVLSDALFATGDYHYAAYALRRAFELEPQLARMQIDKRELYSDPTDFERQLAQVELYLEDHYLDADARLVLAANYLYGGAPDRAIELLDDPFSTEVVESPAGRMLWEAALLAQRD